MTFARLKSGLLCYICNMEIKLKDKIYPMTFNMNSIKAIMVDAGVEEFAELQFSGDLLKQLDFGLLCAFHGINEAAECNGQPKPFLLLADIGRQVQRFTDLLPAIAAFSEGASEFFKSDEAGGK